MDVLLHNLVNVYTNGMVRINIKRRIEKIFVFPNELVQGKLVLLNFNQLIL